MESSDISAQDSPNVASQERRRSSTPDRRGAARGGKYDRRKNRCGACAFFTDNPPAPLAQSHCQKHDKPMAATEFACTKFEPAL